MRSEDPREIELKLTVDPAGVDRLQALLEVKLGPPQAVERLASVYYDSPDQALRRDGATLRVRRTGDGFVQTVKRRRGGAGAALFDRDEWETPITTADLDREALGHTPVGAAAKQLRLARVFETAVERRSWQVEIEGAIIEVALDIGHVEAGRRREPLAELELELKRGAPQSLFDLLRQLDAFEHLSLGIEAKSERGYRLTGDAPRRAGKAEPLDLHKSMDAAAAFRAIAQGCLRHFGQNAPLVVAEGSPEALHQARVALRRLRSALSLFKPLVADAQYDSLRRTLQALSQELGEARNLDVYLENVRQAGAGLNGREAQADLDAVTRRRSTAYDAVVTRLKSPAFHATTLSLIEWIEAGAWLLDDDPARAAARREPVRAAAAAMLQKRWRRLKHRGHHLAALDPQARHQVRIEAKKLRYASDFFTGLVRRPKAAKRLKRLSGALKELQEHLGALNDIETGREIARVLASGGQIATGTSVAIPLRSMPGEAQVAELLAAATRAHAHLVTTKRFWSSWLP